MEQKHIVLITFDQWRGDWFNKQKPELKSIKNLIEKSVWYTECYTTSPHCMPARFSWLTGLLPSQMGITNNTRAEIPFNTKSFASVLREKGWKTAIVGKTHFKSHEDELDLSKEEHYLKSLGFEESIEIAGPRGLRRITCEITKDWEKYGYLSKQRMDLERRYGKGRHPDALVVRETVLPNELYPDIWIKNKAIEKLKKWDNKNSYFLWISFVGPHEPFDTPEPWKGMTNRKEVPRTKKIEDWMKTVPKEANFAKTRAMWKKTTKDVEVESCRKDYADHMKLLDDMTKEILIELSKKGLFDKTTIIMTSDHGEMCGDYELMYKGTFLESAIKVPMLVKHSTAKNKKKCTKKKNSTEIIWAAIGKVTGIRHKKHSILERIFDYRVIEFKNEICILMGNIKAVYSLETGRNLWIATDKDKAIKKLSIIRRVILRLFSKHEIRKRLSKTWVKGNFKKT